MLKTPNWFKGTGPIHSSTPVFHINHEAPIENQNESIDDVTLTSLLSEEVERVNREVSARPKIKVAFSAPREMTLHYAIKASQETLRLAVRGLLDQALDSLVGNDGVIRVTLRPGLRSVSISIEDNGRGLNEAFILKLQEKGVLPRSTGRWSLKEIRRAAAQSGWHMEMHARLGVGARVTFEIPRVDGYAFDSRPRVWVDEEGRERSVSIS